MLQKVAADGCIFCISDRKSEHITVTNQGSRVIRTIVAEINQIQHYTSYKKVIGDTRLRHPELKDTKPAILGKPFGGRIPCRDSRERGKT